ncbi:MAG: hypothetical protein AAGD11_06250 [Planctomycetota bacterium]
MTNSTNQKPAAKFRDGSITATLWENQGKHGVFYNTTIVRSYKDGAMYKDTNSYGATELLQVARLAQLAYDKQLELVQAAKADKAA